MSTIHTGAVIIAILSGSYSLVALLVGSPPEFGVALALCGACWIAAHFIERTVERERAPHGRAVSAARLNRAYGSCHVVFVGAGEYSTRAAHRPRTGLPGARLGGVGDGGHSGRSAIDGGQDWGFAA